MHVTLKKDYWTSIIRDIVNYRLTPRILYYILVLSNPSHKDNIIDLYRFKDGLIDRVINFYYIDT